MRYLVFLVGAFLIFGCSKPLDVSGNWSGSMTYEAVMLDFSMNLVQSEKSVSGSMLVKKIGEQLPVSGTIDKDGKISFSTPVVQGAQFTCTGNASSSSVISGNCDVMAKKSSDEVSNTIFKFSITKS